jgi:hypothetical protein
MTVYGDRAPVHPGAFSLFRGLTWANVPQSHPSYIPRPPAEGCFPWHMAAHMRNPGDLRSGWSAGVSGDHLGAPGRIRTCGTRFRKPLLYPLSYEGLTLVRA